MSYATIDDIFSRYKPIKTLVGSEDMQVTSAEVTSIFIRDAESLVDAHLAARYTVPLSPVPAYITQVTADIALFNMLVEHLPQKPDFFQPRYDRAMGILASIQSGSIVVTSVEAASTGDQEAWSTTTDYHPVFSPVLKIEEQTIDKERVEADQSLRTGDIGYSNSDNC